LTARKRPTRLVVLVAAVMAVLLAEGVLVALVFVSPTAGGKLGRVVEEVSEAWTGTKDEPGIRTTVAAAFHRGYQRWIVPLWSEPRTPKGDPEFTGCVRCHPDYASKRKYSSVYMDHPLHAELGVACATCHKENLHPNPVLPDEAACATCHTEVQQRNRCGLCHPPASLPHFYLLGAPREGVVECDVCHPKKSFATTATVPRVDVGEFNGADRGRCLQCHQATTCQQCHASRHPSNWVATHGEVVGWGGQVTCYSCHTNDWCADRCHSRTPTNPLVPRPLPTGGGP